MPLEEFYAKLKICDPKAAVLSIISDYAAGKHVLSCGCQQVPGHTVKVSNECVIPVLLLTYLLLTRCGRGVSSRIK